MIKLLEIILLITLNIKPAVKSPFGRAEIARHKKFEINDKIYNITGSLSRDYGVEFQYAFDPPVIFYTGSDYQCVYSFDKGEMVNQIIEIDIQKHFRSDMLMAVYYGSYILGHSLKGYNYIVLPENKSIHSRPSNNPRTLAYSVVDGYFNLAWYRIESYIIKSYAIRKNNNRIVITYIMKKFKKRRK